MKKFEELGLSQHFLKTMHELNFYEPTEIQEKAIPLAIAGKDIIGKSATGSGKTLAFGAGIIERIEPSKNIQALILTPTRELAEQVSKSIELFSKFKHLRVTPVYGGVSIEPQIYKLRESDIVVGTPGRILDHLSRRTINLSKLKILVLDEADRMLDMGFLDDVRKIISQCPKERQTMLFSATVNSDIIRIIKHNMINPTEISAQAEVDPAKLEQIFYDVYANQKFSLLVHLLKEEQSKLVMVFCNTKRMADFVARNLKVQGINAMPLHGDLSQNKRSRILESFHKSEKFVLVCTDVAARGLDIKNVSHVYNFDSPKTSTEYIHRIGRTARAGKEGKAITILGDKDYDNFRRVKSDDSLDIKRVEVPKFEIIQVSSGMSRGRDMGRRDFNRDDRDGRRGRRDSGRRDFNRARNQGDHGRGIFARDSRQHSRGRSYTRAY